MLGSQEVEVKRGNVQRPVPACWGAMARLATARSVLKRCPKRAVAIACEFG